MTATLDLAELTQRLRAAGFRSDTRQYLAAHELLLGFAARGLALQDDADRLASHLGPIFCTSPDEQTRFSAIVRDWLGASPMVVAASPAPARRRAFAPARRWRWLFPVLLAALLIVVTAGGAGYWYMRPVLLHVQILMQPGEAERVAAPQAQLRIDGALVSLDAQAGAVIALRRGTPARRLSAQLAAFQPEEVDVNVRTESPLRIILLPVPKPDSPTPGRAPPVQLGDVLVLKPPQTAPPSPVRDWRSAASVGAGCALLLFILLYLWRRVRLRRVLRRLPADRRPDFASLAATLAAPLDEQVLRRVATGLRRVRREAVVDMDVDASVRASAAAAGLFAPVWTARRSIPEYLVLIERRSDNDHYARWIDDQVSRLVEHGVAIDRFWFVDDPRVCFRFEEGTQRRWPLSTLLAQHHRATVLLFHEAGRCVDALETQPLAWLQSLAALPRRVLFTPEPVFHWHRAHHAVASEGFVVLPAGEAGLAMLAALDAEWRIEQLFPAPYARPYPPVLLADATWATQRAAPPSDMQERLLKQLRGYLGPEGLTWLAACALYPELSWDLTLDLAGVVREGSVQQLPMLARLPWLRSGVMPDWLRQVLLAQLSVTQTQRARALIESRLERFVTQAMSANSAAEPALRIGRWVTPAEVVRTAPEDSPMRDAVFLGLVSGRQLDALTYDAPDSLRRVFRQLDELPGAVAPSRTAPRWWDGLRAWCDRNPTWTQAVTSTGAGLLVFGLTAAQFVDVPDPPSAIDRAVTDLAFSSSGEQLLSATRGGDLRWWRLAQAGQPQALLPYARDRLGAMDLRADGQAVALGHADGRLTQHEFEGRGGFDVRAHQGGVNAAMYLQRSRLLASGGDDGLVRLWDAGSGASVGSALAGHRGAVTRLDTFDAGERLASASTDGTVRVWNTARGALEGEALSGHQGGALALRFSPDGRLLASGDLSGVVRLWNMTDRAVRRFEGHQAGVSALIFLGKGEYLVSGGLDKTVRLWDVQSGELVQTQTVPEMVRQLSVSGDRRRLAVSFGEQIWVWPVRYNERTVPDVPKGNENVPVAMDSVTVVRIDPPVKAVARLPMRVRLDTVVTLAAADSGTLAISATVYGGGNRNCRGSGQGSFELYRQDLSRGENRAQINLNLASAYTNGNPAATIRRTTPASSVLLTASLNGNRVAFTRPEKGNPALRLCYGTPPPEKEPLPADNSGWCCARSVTESSDASSYEQKAAPSAPNSARWQVLQADPKACLGNGGYPAKSQAEARAICQKLGRSASAL